MSSKRKMTDPKYVGIGGAGFAEALAESFAKRADLATRTEFEASSNVAAAAKGAAEAIKRVGNIEALVFTAQGFGDHGNRTGPGKSVAQMATTLAAEISPPVIHSFLNIHMTRLIRDTLSFRGRLALCWAILFGPSEDGVDIKTGDPARSPFGPPR